MADISKINPNGTVYNLKDATARTDLQTFMNKWKLTDAMDNVTVSWVGTAGQQILELFFTFTDPNTKLLLQFRYDGVMGFYVTNNGGASWSTIWTK